MAKFSPFASVTKEEQAKKEAALVESVKKIQELKDAARACLKLEAFRVYDEKRQKMDEALTNLTLVIDMLDQAQLWKLQALQSELKAIRGIMSITKDAKQED